MTPMTMYPDGTMQPLDVVPAKSVPLTLVMLPSRTAPYAADTPNGMTRGFATLSELRDHLCETIGVLDRRVAEHKRKPAWHIVDRRLAR